MTDNQTTDLGHRNIGLTRQALEDTLRLYPRTNPAALVFFAGASGLLAGKLTDEDFEWARKARDEWEASRVKR